MDEKLPVKVEIPLEPPLDTKIELEDPIENLTKTQPGPPNNPNYPPPQYPNQYPAQYPNQYPPQYQNQYPPQPAQNVGGQNVYVAGGYYPPPQNVRDQPAYYDRQNNHRRQEQVYVPEQVVIITFDSVAVRNQFVQKVYTILATQLFFTFFFILLTAFVPPIRAAFARYALVISLVSMLVYLITVIVLACFVSVRRSYPINFILLGILTISLTLMLGVITAIVSPVVTLAAVGTTAGVCLLVSIFACQTKWDITKCGMMLCVCTIVLMIYGMIITILVLCGIYIPVLHIIYSALGCFLFCLWLMYDTQVIVGGRRVEISPEEYIMGALTLYVDIVMILMFIIQLFDCCIGS